MPCLITNKSKEDISVLYCGTYIVVEPGKTSGPFDSGIGRRFEDEQPGASEVENLTASQELDISKKQKADSKVIAAQNSEIAKLKKTIVKLSKGD